MQLNSLSLEKKKIIKKEMLHNNKKLFRGETVSPSALPTSNRKLRLVACFSVLLSFFFAFLFLLYVHGIPHYSFVVKWVKSPIDG